MESSNSREAVESPISLESMGREVKIAIANPQLNSAFERCGRENNSTISLARTAIYVKKKVMYANVRLHTDCQRRT